MSTHNFRLNTQDTHTMLMKQRLHRGIFITSFFLLFIIILSVQLIHTSYQKSQINEQIRSSKVSLDKGKKEQIELQMNVKQLNNTDYLQQLIREKDYYTKKGETVYSLPGDVAQDVIRN